MKYVNLCLALLAGLLLFGCNNTSFNADSTISCYTRDTTSGTRDGFFTKIGLEDAKESNEPLTTVVEVSSNDEMITKIKNDVYGIGYISLASYDSEELNGLSFLGVLPTEANVLDGSYKLTRNFNYMVRASYENSDKADIVEAFLAFLTTKDAKTTIAGKEGILEIKNDDPTWESIKANYPICEKDNSAIVVRFGGSTSCTKIAQALSSEFSKKCGNFQAEHNHTGSSDAYKRCQGSEKDGSNYLDIGFASREFKSTEAAAEGTTGKLCTDAIVVVVNKKNTLSQVDASTLVEIYKGEQTKWSDIL